VSSQPAVAPASHAVPEEDDDGWGDFEVAQTAQTTSFPSLEQPNWENKARVTDGEPPRTRLVRASTMELITNSLIDVDRQSPATDKFRKHNQFNPAQPAKPKRNDANVLFDVAEFELGEDDIKEEDEDEFDEFGDFESTAAPSAPSRQASSQSKTKFQPPSMDLLSLDEPQPSQGPQTTRARPHKQPPERLQNIMSFAATSKDSTSPKKSPFLQSPGSNYPQAPKSPSFQARNPFPELAIKTPTPTSVEFNNKDNPKTETPVTAWPSFTSNALKSAGADKKEEDDGWGAWEDDEKVVASKKTETDNTKPLKGWEWDADDHAEPAVTRTPKDTDPPPINVPPPSIILSIFPDLLNSGGEFFKPMSKQATSIKQQILSDPKAVDFLHGYILLATTAARVIAGRKHRWHRDKILAKSMSISASGSKGMKLAGVDKTQSAREDREAADVAVTWRENVGRLRSAVAAANAAGKSNLKVPELSDSLLVQTAKMVPTAPKPCIICGLKRDERVAKVDFDVEDSFGEWWVEHWGHRACKNFWVEHEQKLRQR
jgi:hypothetical protein